jgi:hypothetical protein
VSDIIRQSDLCTALFRWIKAVIKRSPKYLHFQHPTLTLLFCDYSYQQSIIQAYHRIIDHQIEVMTETHDFLRQLVSVAEANDVGKLVRGFQAWENAGSQSPPKASDDYSLENLVPVLHAAFRSGNVEIVEGCFRRGLPPDMVKLTCICPFSSPEYKHITDSRFYCCRLH